MGVTETELPQEFTASRWTRGNRVFPTRISVSRDRVLRRKPRLGGSTEESIAITKIASVKLANGLLFSDVCIESTGGADPITSHGHRKRDAQQIRSLIEQLQEERDRT